MVLRLMDTEQYGVTIVGFRTVPGNRRLELEKELDQFV